jgi:hypothetical protein
MCCRAALYNYSCSVRATFLETTPPNGQAAAITRALRRNGHCTGTTDHSTYNRPTSPVRGPHEYSVASMWLKGHSNPGNPAKS